MEEISALMDGELEPSQAQSQLARLKQESALRERWHEFHLVGDAMRGERLLSDGFNDRLSARLAQEPTVLAPRRFARPSRPLTYALSAAASVAAVAFVAWVALGPTGPLSQQPGLTAAVSKPVPVPAVAVPDVPVQVSLPAEGAINAYLFAHQGFSPSTAIQGLAPYIRTVSTARQREGR